MKGQETYENPISPSEFDMEDFQENKVYAALSYLIFFLPFIACPKSIYARYHANQGLLLFMTAILAWLVTALVSFVPVIGWLVSVVLHIGLIAFVIMGICNALTNKKQPLPVIGRFHIFA